MNSERVVELAKAMREREWLRGMPRQDPWGGKSVPAAQIDELLDLIDPPAEAKVDWTKEIQGRNGVKAHHRLHLGQPDSEGYTRLIHWPDENDYTFAFEDGRYLPSGGCSEWDIINSPVEPAPAEEVTITTEGTTATHFKGKRGLALSCRDGERVAIFAENDSAMIVFDSVEEAKAAGWLFDRWEFGTWNKRG